MKIVIRMCVLMCALVMGGTVFAATASDVKIGTTKDGVNVTVDRILKEGMGGRALVTVTDAAKQPLLGLGISDFTVSEGSTQGKIVSLMSVAETKDIPLNIVMVLDNSFSMVESDSIKTLLAGVDKVLSVLRPVDTVSIVVFDKKLITKVGDRKLRVQTFKSSDAEKLRAFARKAYGKGGVTSKTVLYEGMLAGLDIVSKMPKTGPHIMIVFSDGEDLNSKVKSDDVAKAAKKAGAFNAYAIDYRQGPETDKFLAAFAADNRGKIWKTRTKTELQTIFDTIATTIDYSYILTYVFIPPAVPQPVVMVFPEAALFDFDKAELKPEGKEQIKAYREDVKSGLSRADMIRITGHTDNIGKADYNMKLSQQRAEAMGDYLKSIGVTTKMEVVGEGLSRPIFDNRTKEGRAQNRRVEVEVYGLEK
jgi:outer membrane protein OmpA-like peptidoglycan-associated protein